MPNPEEEEDEKEGEILRGARQLAPKLRSAFLDERCGNDVALRQRVELMLAVVEVDASRERSPDPDKEDVRIEGPGSTIGPYKLIERIGEGGFGIVFLAEQLEPIRRHVALKVIKPGMDTYQVIARFEAERQALALMEHENIARVLDGGETATGRPYFVMELVRGVRITEYCDQARLSVQARLDLFATVCDAVQHAHQKGVIHRDLKPSNILIAQSNGKPLVKVIDFGVAKAIGQQLTEKTLFSCFQMIGTPLYMSPEQAEGGLDVDTRTDIYGLGVILYELMTGTTPLDRKRLEVATFDEIRRIIREDEPTRPSTRLSPTIDTTAISVNRSSDPLRLRRMLSGELDWITLKCLEKDPTRRYATANSLAQDVRRFLANEPVEAGPPSVSYRLRKLFVRHRAPVLTAAFLLLVLVGGIVGTTIGLIKAETAETEARVQRDHAIAASESAHKRLSQIEKGVDIITSIFSDLMPDTIDREGKTLREVLGVRLETAVKQLEGEAIGDPLVVARLQCKLSDSLIALGHPQSVIELLTRARATFTEALGAEDRETIRCQTALANAYRWINKLDLALAIGDEALRLARERLDPHDVHTMHCLDIVGLILAGLGHMDRAIPLFEEELELRKEVLGVEDPTTILAMANLAGVYLKAKKIDQSITLAQESIELGEQYLGEGHSTVLAVMNTLASAYELRGKHDLALPLKEQALKRVLAKFGPDHPWTLVFIGNLGSGYLRARQFEQAATTLERGAEYVEKVGFDGETAVNVVNHLQNCLHHMQKFEEAEQWGRKFVAAEKKRGVHSVAYANALAALASTLMKQKKWSAAEPALLECVEVLQSLADEPAEPATVQAPAQALETESRPDEKAGSPSESQSRLLAALQQLEQLYRASGNDAEAEKWRLELQDATARWK